MKPHVHESFIRVRYGDTDQMGFAHHAEFLLWFETARTELLRDLGFRYRDLEARGILLTVIESQCRHLKPAFYDELIRVRAWTEELRKLKMRIAYEVHDESGKLLATGYTVLGSIGRDGRPNPLPDDVTGSLTRSLRRPAGGP